MSKKSLIEKNKNRQILIEKYAEKRKALTTITKDRSMPMAEVYKASVQLSLLPRYSTKICLTNRCRLTGRARGVYRKRFDGLSRIMLRELASSGLINGVLKG